MAIIQTTTNSFKRELLLGVHDFRTGGDVFKLALYTAAADLGAQTTSYTTSGEVTGAGYTAGGITLSSLGVSSDGAVAFVDFADATFFNSTITARGALIYNSTPSALGPGGSPLVNPAVAVLNFGSDRQSINSPFTIVFPPASASSAVIRIE